MSDLPVLPLWVTKYEGNTAHLTLEEDGAYMRLLRLCWRTPGCSVPADAGWVMRHMRCDLATFERVVQPILDEFFERLNGRWHSQKLTEIYQETNERTQRRKSAGAKGGKAKALKTQETASSNAKNDQKQIDGKPYPKPEPKVDGGGGVAAEIDFDGLQQNCRKWANGSLNLTHPGAHDLSPIIRLLNPSGGKPCTMDDVRLGITKAAAAAPHGQICSLTYFEKPIIRERDRRLAPLPEPEISNERTGQGQPRRSGDYGATGSGGRAGRQHGGNGLVSAALRAVGECETQGDLSDRSEDWRAERVA